MPIDAAKETEVYGKMMERIRVRVREEVRKVQRYESIGARRSFDATRPLCTVLIFGIKRKESERDEEAEKCVCLV